MDRVLLHCCCAPCSVSCIDPLRAEGIEPVAFWYNPNIHPFMEYASRRDCMIEFAKTKEVELRIQEEYGLREFCKNVIQDVDHRCSYCYTHRLMETAKYARDHGFEAFTSTLFASTYQDHELMILAANAASKAYDVEFLYRDFRPFFREGNKEAREMGLYMQKYCGCIFSEQDRYQKRIDREALAFSKYEEGFVNHET